MHIDIPELNTTPVTSLINSRRTLYSFPWKKSTHRFSSERLLNYKTDSGGGVYRRFTIIREGSDPGIPQDLVMSQDSSRVPKPIKSGPKWRVETGKCVSLKSCRRGHFTSVGGGLPSSLLMHSSPHIPGQPSLDGFVSPSPE